MRSSSMTFRRITTVFATIVPTVAGTCPISHDCNGGYCSDRKDDKVVPFGEYSTIDLPFAKKSGLDAYPHDEVHCVCPAGTTGYHCEVQMELCGKTNHSHVCFHGSPCRTGISDEGREFYSCDCRKATGGGGSHRTNYAGRMCQHSSTSLCTTITGERRPHSFCTNFGTCLPNTTDDDQAHPGCNCTEGWYGSHCQYESGEQPLSMTRLEDGSSTDAQKSGNEHIQAALFFVIIVIIACVICAIIAMCRRLQMERRSSRSVVSGMDREGASDTVDGGTLRRKNQRRVDDVTNEEDVEII